MTVKPLICIQVEELLHLSKTIQVPQVFFKAIPNHTAVLALADILAAYLHSGAVRSRTPLPLMEGDELLLFPYERFAEKLNVSVRSFSRAIDLLAQLGMVQRSRKDRQVDGRLVRNVVGVVPNVQVIGEKCDVNVGDILAAPQLSQSQRSQMQRFAEDFADVIGKPYRPSPSQQIADIRAMATVKRTKARYAGRDFNVKARQYLAKAAAQEEDGGHSISALDRSGQPLPEYTLEIFIERLKDKGYWPVLARRPRR